MRGNLGQQPPPGGGMDQGGHHGLNSRTRWVHPEKARGDGVMTDTPRKTASGREAGIDAESRSGPSWRSRFIATLNNHKWVKDPPPRERGFVVLASRAAGLSVVQSACYVREQTYNQCLTA